MVATRFMLPLLLLGYPLVSHFATINAHPELSYLWLALSLAAPALLWSLFSNFVNPTLIFLVFVIEYQIRRRILKEVSHKDFFDCARDLVRTGLPMSDSGCHARR